LHRGHAACPLEQAGQRPDVEGRPVGEHDPAGPGDSDPGPPLVVGAAQRGTPRSQDVLVNGCGDMTVLDDQVQILPDANDVRAHVQAAVPPHPDRDVTVPVVDDRGYAAHQRAVVGPVEVEAAVRAGDLEPAVEGGDEPAPVARRYPRRGVPVARAGILHARVKLEWGQGRVHLDDALNVGGVHRVGTQPGPEHGRLAVHAGQHAPDALSWQRLACRGLQPLRRRELGEGCGAAGLVAERGSLGSRRCVEAGHGGRPAPRLGRRIGQVLAQGDQRTEIVVTAPLGQPLGEGSAARHGQRVPYRPAGDADEGDDDDLEPGQDREHPAAVPEPAPAAAPSPGPGAVPGTADLTVRRVRAAFRVPVRAVRPVRPGREVIPVASVPGVTVARAVPGITGPGNRVAPAVAEPSVVPVAGVGVAGVGVAGAGVAAAPHVIVPSVAAVAGLGVAAAPPVIAPSVAAVAGLGVAGLGVAGVGVAHVGIAASPSVIAPSVVAVARAGVAVVAVSAAPPVIAPPVAAPPVAAVAGVWVAAAPPVGAVAGGGVPVAVAVIAVAVIAVAAAPAVAAPVAVAVLSITAFAPALVLLCLAPVALITPGVVLVPAVRGARPAAGLSAPERAPVAIPCCRRAGAVARPGSAFAWHRPHRLRHASSSAVLRRSSAGLSGAAPPARRGAHRRGLPGAP